MQQGAQAPWKWHHQSTDPPHLIYCRCAKSKQQVCLMAKIRICFTLPTKFLLQPLSSVKDLKSVTAQIKTEGDDRRRKKSGHGPKFSSSRLPTANQSSLSQPMAFSPLPLA
uniref:Uncharacterized protein n=1 Tax=Sphaerodactylus townsendi TaxID=933632 RepID=A0ACB8F2T0_9SAUR